MVHDTPSHLFILVFYTQAHTGTNLTLTKVEGYLYLRTSVLESLSHRSQETAINTGILDNWGAVGVLINISQY